MPVDRVWDRVELAKNDSDTSYFMALLYVGEFVLKATALSLIAAIKDDADRNRYRQLYRIVRSDGLGDWCASIDDILTGPAAQHLCDEARTEQKELTQKVSSGSWQFEAVYRIDECLRRFEPQRDSVPFKVDARRFFVNFTELRNKTRAHGAITGNTCSAICKPVEEALRLVYENLTTFKRDWAFLHRNLSGKYRVSPMGGQGKPFEDLKSAKNALKWGPLRDGVYIFYDRPYLVELFESDVELLDFSVPNGAFTPKRFELLSYLTDSRTHHDSAPFMTPGNDLPSSETQGLGLMDVQGKVFTNSPQVRVGYIERPSLQNELAAVLSNDRHPIVTLVGRGGIGKTYLALSVIKGLSFEERFGAIFWFSARDIDLLADGPKLVRPHLLGERDISQEYARLVAPEERGNKGFDSVQYFGAALTGTAIGFPSLFVFDNFETVRNPVELFTWIDTFIRPPNKVLITTRSREFKGDYPVEVLGMTEEESQKLITATSTDLGILPLLTEDYRKELVRESEGHPYVIKVLLGEVAKAGKLSKIERIVAGKEEILDALFERTYSALSPSARQIFLTLCSWRSTVPQLALEAVSLRTGAERVDVEQAVEELRRSSFCEIITSPEDNEIFVSVPLVASVFGRRKLSVSPYKSAVEANLELLRFFGAGQRSDLRHGIGPRIDRLFKSIAERLAKDPERLGDYTPMLQFIAQRYAPAWLLLASLHEEGDSQEGSELTKEFIRRYTAQVTTVSEKRIGWNRLAQLCRKDGDGVGEVHALVELCDLPNTTFDVISNAANRWNQVFRQQLLSILADERDLLGRRLLKIADSKIEEASATDCSRLAWLSRTIHNEAKASDYVKRGISLEPENEYCLKLAHSLNIQVPLPTAARGNAK